MCRCFSHIKQYKKQYGQQYKECGASALYVLCLLPFLIAITFALLDVARWNFLRDATIQEASAIAKLCARSLPDTGETSACVRNVSIQSKFPELESASVAPFFDSTSASFGASFAIGVKIDADYIPSLAKMANALIPSLDLKMHLSKSVVAQYRPGDYVLVISNASTLRPNAINNTFQPALQKQPPASIFRCSKPYAVDAHDWLSGWNDADSALFFTQACYNPAFSTLKLSSIALLDAISEINNNKVAVMFSPGNNVTGAPVPLTTLHSISSGFTTEGQTIFGSDYNDLFGLNNIACALFSANYLGASPYRLPASDTEDALSQDYRFCPIQIELNQNIIDREFLSSPLMLRHAIFWQIARQQTNTDVASMDFQLAILNSLQELLSKSAEQRQNEYSVRGNLAATPKRHIFVFTDSLNGYQPTQEIISALIANNTKLSFIVYSHEFLAENTALQNNTDFLQIQSIISTLQAEGHNNLSAHITSDNGELFDTIIPQALSEIKEIAVREYGN